MADITQVGGQQSTGGGAFSTMFNSWMTQPFKTQMSAFSWILFLGFIVIVCFAWTRVLSHIVE